MMVPFNQCFGGPGILSTSAYLKRGYTNTCARVVRVVRERVWVSCVARTNEEPSRVGGTYAEDHSHQEQEGREQHSRE